MAKNKTAQGYREKMNVERELNYYTDEVYLNYPTGKDIRIFSMLPLIAKHHQDALNRSIAFFDRFYYQVFKNKETCQTLLQYSYTFFAYLIVLFKVLAYAITIGGLSKYIGAITLMNLSISEWIDLNQKISLQTEFVGSFNAFLNLKSEKHSGQQPLTLEPGAPFVILDEPPPLLTPSANMKHSPALRPCWCTKQATLFRIEWATANFAIGFSFWTRDRLFSKAVMTSLCSRRMGCTQNYIWNKPVIM